MKQVFAMSIAALMASATFAVAQDGDMFISRDDAGAYRVYGPDNMEGTELLMGENGAAPTDCPDGSYYRNADNFIIGCGTEDPLGVGPIEEGAMMQSGDPFPAGASRLMPNGQPFSESNENTGTDIPNAGDGAADGGDGQSGGEGEGGGEGGGGDAGGGG